MIIHCAHYMPFSLPKSLQLGAVYMKGGRSWHQEDPRSWIVLVPFVLRIQSTRKGLYLSLALGSRDKPDKNGGGSSSSHVNKGRPFRLALLRADYCNNSAER